MPQATADHARARIGHQSPSGPVRVGVLVPSREAILTGRHDPRHLVRFAQECERLGVDDVWVGDSLLARPRDEPLTLLAAIAARTERLGLGTAALTAALRNPLPAAHALATLDRLSGGRLTLALGAGFPHPATAAELAAAGVPAAARRRRLAEIVALWRQAWSADGSVAPVPFEGTHWRIPDLRGLPAPARPGGPPLWFAGSGPAGLALTAEVFDGWLPYAPTPDSYAEGLERLSSELRRTGREPADVTAALYVTVLPGEPTTTAATLERYFGAYYGAGLDTVGSLQAVVHGDPEECTRQLRAYVDAGARHLVMRIGDLDAHHHLSAVTACTAPLRSAAAHPSSTHHQRRPK